MRLQELKRQHGFALNKAEQLVNLSETRTLTENEQNELDTALAAVNSLTPQIKKIERNNTIFNRMVNGVLPTAPGNLRQARTPEAPVVLSEDYHNGRFW